MSIIPLDQTAKTGLLMCWILQTDGWLSYRSARLVSGALCRDRLVALDDERLLSKGGSIIRVELSKGVTIIA